MKKVMLVLGLIVFICASGIRAHADDGVQDPVENNMSEWSYKENILKDEQGRLISREDKIVRKDRIIDMNIVKAITAQVKECNAAKDLLILTTDEEIFDLVYSKMVRICRDFDPDFRCDILEGNVNFGNPGLDCPPEKFDGR